MTGSRVILPDHTVLIENGRVVSVGPADGIELAKGITQIKGNGRYLLPGLADMHVHLEYFKDPSVLGLFVANGVTTVRNMDGRPYILRWKKRVQKGELTGPTIFTGGPILDGDPPLRDDNLAISSPEEARAAVERQAQAGYNFVKIYTNLSAEAYAAVLRTAVEEDIPVAGHSPRQVQFEHVLAGPQASLEHLDGYDELIEAPDSPHRDSWHWSKLYLAMPISTPLVESAAAKTRQAGLWNVPTLVQKEKIAPPDQLQEWLEDPRMRCLPSGVTEHWDPRTWEPWRLEQITRFDEDDWGLIERGKKNRADLIRALQSAGAGVLVGTDTPNPFVFPGFSVHEELQLLVDGGLSPYQALDAATAQPARFLGQSGVWGTVEVGARADLLLVGGNPVSDLEVLREPDGVFLRGRWLERSELQEMLRVICDYE